ncbi:MAG: homoserine dehydrogenase [Thermosediminibacterales bacterium]|nr:homoserine dehydrogenase [Thermosediminibacterales bacterium]MDK2836091.1 homoserine dehydrogenase [Thermosediminibacterales bacterium]
MWKLINIGLLGLGTVATGVVEVLEKNQKNIEKKVGEAIKIKKILVRDINKKRNLPYNLPLTTKPEEILEDSDIDIIVELIGGEEPALSYIKTALTNGKHVVTANKEIISKHGKILFGLAEKAGKNLLFEASVGGGIPIIRPLKECLAANEIYEIMGIVNGTTNYILTEMTERKKEFGQVLKDAQRLGYAESDPSADIDGFDAARKLAILASIGFNTRINPAEIYTEGIRNITSKDILYAKELGYVIKLLAVSRKRNGRIEASVSPVFMPIKHPLAGVNDVYNAIMVTGYPVGRVMFFGRGAGKDPTSSAVVGDIIEIARNKNNCKNVLCTCFVEKPVINIGETESRFYLRLQVEDKPGVLAKIAGIFSNYNVSIHSVVQKSAEKATAELVLITHMVKEKNMKLALDEILSYSQTLEVSNVIRVEGDV